MSVNSAVEREDFQANGVALLSSAHAVHDTYTAFLPALLPVLIQKFSLTNTAAGLLSVFIQFPSLLQPVIGNIADRKNLKIFIILAPTITGSAMSLLGIAPSYGFLAFLLVVAGLSSATFHAVGPVLSSSLSGKRLGKGMSFWMVGGELGRSLGPIITVTAIGYLTLDRFPWLLMAGVMTSLFLSRKLDTITTLPKTTIHNSHWKTALKKMRPVLLPIAFITFARSLILASMTTFLPTFLTFQGSSLWMAGASLTILEVAGMIGAFFSGALSDKIGRRRLLVVSYAVTPILTFIFISATGLMQIPLLILLGVFVISVVPVIMAVVLENAPENRSLVNGFYMAMSFILTSLAVVLVGFLSDILDLRYTFMISAGLLPLGLPFIFMLPKSKKNI